MLFEFGFRRLFIINIIIQVLIILQLFVTPAFSEKVKTKISAKECDYEVEKCKRNIAPSDTFCKDLVNSEHECDPGIAWEPPADNEGTGSSSFFIGAPFVFPGMPTLKPFIPKSTEQRTTVEPNKSGEEPKATEEPKSSGDDNEQGPNSTEPGPAAESTQTTSKMMEDIFAKIFKAETTTENAMEKLVKEKVGEPAPNDDTTPSPPPVSEDNSDSTPATSGQYEAGVPAEQEQTVPPAAEGAYQPMQVASESSAVPTDATTVQEDIASTTVKPPEGDYSRISGGQGESSTEAAVTDTSTDKDSSTDNDSFTDNDSSTSTDSSASSSTTNTPQTDDNEEDSTVPTNSESKPTKSINKKNSNKNVEELESIKSKLDTEFGFGKFFSKTTEQAKQETTEGPENESTTEKKRRKSLSKRRKHRPRSESSSESSEEKEETDLETTTASGTTKPVETASKVDVKPPDLFANNFDALFESKGSTEKPKTEMRKKSDSKQDKESNEDDSSDKKMPDNPPEKLMPSLAPTSSEMVSSRTSEEKGSGSGRKSDPPMIIRKKTAPSSIEPASKVYDRKVEVLSNKVRKDGSLRKASLDEKTKDVRAMKDELDFGFGNFGKPSRKSSWPGETVPMPLAIANQRNKEQFPDIFKPPPKRVEKERQQKKKKKKFGVFDDFEEIDSIEDMGDNDDEDDLGGFLSGVLK